MDSTDSDCSLGTSVERDRWRNDIRLSLFLLLFAGISVLVQLAACFCFGIVSRVMAMMFFTYAVCSVGNLLGIWAAIGSRHSCLRMAIVMAASTVYIALWFDIWVTAILIQAIVTSVPLFAIRMAGISLTGGSRLHLPWQLDSLVSVLLPPPWSWFGRVMSSLAIATLASSICVLIYTVSQHTIDPLINWESAAMFGSIGFVTPPALWAILSTGKMLMRVVAFVLPIVIGSAMLTLVGFPWSAAVEIVLITTTWTVLLSLALRYFGYRLLWRQSVVL